MKTTKAVAIALSLILLPALASVVLTPVERATAQYCEPGIPC